MDLQQEIKDAIAKNMPSYVGEQLQRLLAEGAESKVMVTRVQKMLDTAVADRDALKAKLAQHADIDVRESSLDVERKALADRDIALIRKDAALTAAIAVAELKGVKDTTDQFLRNTVIRNTTQSNVVRPIEGHPGGNGYNGSMGTLVKGKEGHVTDTQTDPAGLPVVPPASSADY